MSKEVDEQVARLHALASRAKDTAEALSRIADDTRKAADRLDHAIHAAQAEGLSDLLTGGG